MSVYLSSHNANYNVLNSYQLKRSTVVAYFVFNLYSIGWARWNHAALPLAIFVQFCRKLATNAGIAFWSVFMGTLSDDGLAF